MDYTDVIDAILDGSVDGKESMVYDALKRRKEIANSKKIVRISVGDRVRFNSLARPKYLVGAEASVKKINKTTVVVQFDDTPLAGKYRNVEVRTPVSIVDLIT